MEHKNIFNCRYDDETDYSSVAKSHTIGHFQPEKIDKPEVVKPC